MTENQRQKANGTAFLVLAIILVYMIASLLLALVASKGSARAVV